MAQGTLFWNSKRGFTVCPGRSTPILVAPPMNTTAMFSVEEFQAKCEGLISTQTLGPCKHLIYLLLLILSTLRYIECNGEGGSLGPHSVIFKSTEQWLLVFFYFNFVDWRLSNWCHTAPGPKGRPIIIAVQHNLIHLNALQKILRFYKLLDCAMQGEPCDLTSMHISGGNIQKCQSKVRPVA